MNDTSQITATVALCNGDLGLASEKLAMPQTTILLLLSTDPEAQRQLLKHMQAKLLLDAYTNVQAVSELIQDDLTQFKPAEKLEALRTYSELFANLMKTSQVPDLSSGVNVYERIISSLPPQVREAITVLTPNTTPNEQTVITGVRRRIQTANETELD